MGVVVVNILFSVQMYGTATQTSVFMPCTLWPQCVLAVMVLTPGESV